MSLKLFFVLFQWLFALCYGFLRRSVPFSDVFSEVAFLDLRIVFKRSRCDSSTQRLRFYQITLFPVWRDFRGTLHSSNRVATICSEVVNDSQIGAIFHPSLNAAIQHLSSLHFFHLNPCRQLLNFLFEMCPQHIAKLRCVQIRPWCEYESWALPTVVSHMLWLYVILSPSACAH